MFECRADGVEHVAERETFIEAMAKAQSMVMSAHRIVRVIRKEDQSQVAMVFRSPSAEGTA